MMMMKSLLAFCLVAVCLGAPTGTVEKDVHKAVQKKDHDSSPMAPFLDIMKEALNPNNELKGFFDAAMGVKHEDGDAKADAPDMNAMMLKAAMTMASVMSPTPGKDGKAPDPLMTVLLAAQKGVQSMADGPNADPMLKILETGIKVLIAGENGETINPFQLVLDLIAPDGKPMNDDPLMEIAVNSIKAAADDKTGDPLNAMIQYVLEDPTTSKNPVVMMAKTMMTMFPQLTQDLDIGNTHAKAEKEKSL